MIKNEEYMEYLRIIDGRQRRRFVNAINLLNSLDEASMIENVDIIEKEDSQRGITELVIDFYDMTQARINITGNSIHAIYSEFLSFIVKGEATALFYEGPRVKG